MKAIKVRTLAAWDGYLYGEWWKLILPVLLVIVVFTALRTNDIRDKLSRMNDQQRGSNIQTLVLTDLLQAESGQRGYILTGDQKHFYSQYAGALGVLKRDRVRMNSYLAQHPDVKGYRVRLNLSIDAKLHEMEDALKVYKESGREAAAQFILSAKGYELMEDVTNQIYDVRYQQLETIQKNSGITGN
jgi:CHASE3 domain sensor protein